MRVPDRVTVAGRSLVLNGMGLREASVFAVDVYVASLYVERRTRSAQEILRPDRAKRIVLRFVRDVSRREIRGALRAGFRQNAARWMPGIRDRVNQSLSWVPAMREGSEYRFTYVPGRGVEGAFNGRVRGTIAGGDFGSAMFSLFVGPLPSGDGVKRGLLGGACD